MDAKKLPSTEVEKLKFEPLSLDDIKQTFNKWGMANVINLFDVTPNNYENKNDLFGNNDHVILFISITDKFMGHWMAIIKNENGSIYWMDSTAMFPLSILDKMKAKNMNLFGQTKYILQLLGPMKYNEHVYQPSISDTMTCGRWTIAFIALRRMFPNKFSIKFVYDVLEKIKNDNKFKSFNDVIVNLVN